MRIAALYDIHGNLPALDAVLADVRSARVDRIVVGGDVLPGPMPRTTLDRLQALDAPVDFIYGNGETAVLEHLAGRIPAAVPELYRPVIAWCASQIGSAHAGAIGRWPMMLRLGDVLFCHATPRDENEIFTARTPEAVLRPIFDAARAPLVVCGHTHTPFDRTIGATRVVNAGSVGMPFGRAGADWLLLTTDVEPRHVDYDRDAAADLIRATTCPMADEFFIAAIRRPPPELSRSGDPPC